MKCTAGDQRKQIFVIELINGIAFTFNTDTQEVNTNVVSLVVVPSCIAHALVSKSLPKVALICMSTIQDTLGYHNSSTVTLDTVVVYLWQQSLHWGNSKVVKVIVVRQVYYYYCK